MFAAGINAALSAYKDIGSKGFKGFFAGIVYQSPLRTYFRDSYWTIQAVLPFRAELVKEQILFLAEGVHEGQCPSAVLAGCEREFSIGSKHYPQDWWSDHYDSPSYFVMMLYDYLCWTADRSVLKKKINGVSIWDKAKDCLKYLQSRDQDGDYLFEKDYCMRDWTDVIYRSDWVTYDLTLYYRALNCAQEIAEHLGESPQAEEYKHLAKRVREGINKKMWQEEKGYYLNYKRWGRDEPQPCEIARSDQTHIRLPQDFVEDHLSIDTLLTVLYGVADKPQSESILKKAEALLESRNNKEQPYGDWGMMCCWPHYQNSDDLFGIAKLPYSYVNGGDWFYWDGIYALTKLLRGKDGWDYPLTRWWSNALEHNWLTSIEYYSPLYNRGSLLQGWSSMPAAAVIMGGFGFYPNLAGQIKLKVPPWGDCHLKGILFRQDKYDIEVKKGKLTVRKNGQLIDTK